MRKQDGQGGLRLLSAMVLAGVVTGGVGAWGQDKGVTDAGAPAAAPATTPATTQEAAPEAGTGAGLRKAGEVSLAEDVSSERMFREWGEIRSALMARDGKKAKEIADRLVTRNPNKPDAYLVRAELLGQFNAMADAKRDLDKALELEPDNARANAMSAMVQARGGDSTAALEKVDKALKTNPNSASLLAVKADILAGRQDVAGVIEALKGPAGTLKDPEGAGLVNAKLAQAYGGNKQFPEALKAIQRTITLRPGDMQVVVIKAQILEASGDLVGAYDLFLQVKTKPGALAANTQFLGQLDAKLKLMEPEVKKLRAQRATEAQAKTTAQEMEAVNKGRAKALAVMEAYQKAPGDTQARDAAAEYMLQLSSSKPLEVDGQLIEIHKSERAVKPVDKAPSDALLARMKVHAAMNEDKTLYTVYYSETPEETLKKIEELIKEYPEVKCLEMIATIKFGQKKYKESAYYASLSAGMAALEEYQLPYVIDEDALWWGGASTGLDSHCRYLAAQAKRFDEGKLTPADEVAAAYIDAREKKDWVKVYELYYQKVDNLAWYGTKAPGASRVTTGHFKYAAEMEKAMVAKGKILLKAGDKDVIKKFLELIDNGSMNKEETMEFKMAAQRALGGDTAVMAVVTKTLGLYPFNGPARLALGDLFEKQNKPNDAMYHYNTGAKGLPAQGLTGTALENAKARDRIEATIGKEWIKAYTSFIDAERSIAAIEKQRRAMVYAAVTRVLPSHNNKPLLHLVRGQEAYYIGMYEECIQDEKKAVELNKENVYSANSFIGDASYMMSRKLEADKAGRDKLLKQSADAYSVALEKAPDKANQATLLYSRATRYKELTEDDKALADYTKASDLYDDRMKNKAWSFFEISKLKEKKGDIAGAKVDAQKAVDMSRLSWTGSEKAPGTFGAQVTALSKK